MPIMRGRHAGHPIGRYDGTLRCRMFGHKYVWPNGSNTARCARRGCPFGLGLAALAWRAFGGR